MRTWITLTVFSILLGCTGTKNVTVANEPPSKQVDMKTYTYSDGNANRYIVSRDSFEYKPVKREESATGQYDGGSPVKSVTDPGLFRQLEELVQLALAAKEEHTTERAKGTGKIEILEAGRSTTFILPMNSARRKALEDVLVKMKEIK